MTLSTRLTYLLIVITTLVALLVGGYSVTTATHAQYATLNNAIDTVATSGAGHPLTALSDAINMVQQDNLNLTLDVIDASGHGTVVANGTVALSGRPTRADVLASLDGLSTSSDLPGFVYRSIAIGGGDYLLIAGSTSAISASSHRVVERTVLVGILAALVMGIVARLFMRRDLRTFAALTSFATRVANGAVDLTPPEASGSTDVHELQRALTRMVAALQSTIETEKRTSEAMQRFIGDASHELRTPLTVIKGYTDLLATTPNDDAQRERALARMRTETVRMESLVADLLFLAEVREVGRHDHVELDLSEVVATATRDFALDHPERPLTERIAPSIRIRARREYVERLLANALTNVVRHTAPSDPLRVTLDGPDPATLRIEDGGPGLPDASYGQRLEQFRRFDPSRSRASGGSGLGMSIMADVTDALGGTLTTERSDLGGLALVFRFPTRSLSDVPGAAPVGS